jgi:hypothetical protein
VHKGFIGYFGLLLTVPLGVSAQGDGIRLAHAEQPAGDRWMYLWNATPGTRGSASTYSPLPDGAGPNDEDRMAQFLIKFDTVAAGIPAGLGVENYHPHRVVLTTVLENAGILYDPTEDDRQTYGLGALADSDPGRPLELHGTGFRGGFTAANFQETSAYGIAVRSGRNAFALGFSAEGAARDVSNQVTIGVDSIPWAVGRLLTREMETEEWREAAPGSPVRRYDRAVFQLDLSLPGVADYVKQGFHNGALWLTLSSLHSSFQEAASGFPSYFTKDHPEQALFHDVAPTLDVEYRLPLRVSAFRHSAMTNQTHLEWNASPGFQYVVETSETLTGGSWRPMNLIPLTTAQPGKLTYETTNSATRAFYRIARIEP